MKKCLKPAIALLLSAVILLGTVPTAFAEQTGGKRLSIRPAELSELEEQYLSDSEARAAEYPNGAMMLVETSAEMDMGKTYAIDIFRQGGTKGEAKIKLSTIDMSAGYNEAYRLHLSDDLNDSGVKGEKKLYYYATGVPYIARMGTQETQVMTRDNVDDVDEAKQDASEINDMSAENMPRSTETVLTFAEGENKKTVFIETMKPSAVTDDLEFMLALSEPENCSISANTSGMYKIKETRDKPAAKLTITSEGAHPDDEEAYISVKRSGNLGGYDSFHVETKSDTAKAGEDYVAVALDLHFIPNQSEIKVPVTILEGARNGESFRAELSELSGNAVAENSFTNVIFDSGKDVTNASVGDSNAKQWVTNLTYKTGNRDDRKYEFVELENTMSIWGVLGDRGDATASYGDHKYHVGYSVGFFGDSHTTYTRSNKSMDMYGVSKVHMCYDVKSGSLKADTGVVCFANSVPYSGNDKGMNSWRNSHSNCKSIDLWNVAPSHLTTDWNITDHSADQYLFICCYRSACWGHAGIQVHNYNGSNDCALRLELEQYNVYVKDPDKVMMYNKGKLEPFSLVSNAKITNPDDPNGSTTNHAEKCYRYDSMTVSASIDSRFGQNLPLRGIYVIDSDNDSRRSSLVSLKEHDTFTLDPDFLRTYSSYIHNNTIKIEPCYQFDPVEFTVQDYEDPATGLKFKADNSACTGYLTVNGNDYGTVTWSNDSRRGGKYYTGDEICFTYHPGTLGVSNTINYEYRATDIKSELPSQQKIQVSNETTNEINLKLEKKYIAVTPKLVSKESKTRLVVSHPDNGSFTSKGSKYATTDADGRVIIAGCYEKTQDGEIDRNFDSCRSGQRIDLTAAPNEGYYAIWKYTNAVTHKEETYYGNTFHYIVQNPSFPTDNLVSLSFEKVQENLHKAVKGKISVPEGTALHPATSASAKNLPAEGAMIYMDGFVGKADKNGQFMMNQVNKDDYGLLQLGGYHDNMRNYTQTNRALIIYNSNTYVCDVTLKLTNSSKLCATTEIVLDSSTTKGVIPTGASAYSPEITGVYGSTITLHSGRVVNFKVSFDAKNIPADSPVNFARFTFENEKGVQHGSGEAKIENGASYVTYGTVLTEKAKQGDRMYVEFYNQTGDRKTPYGRFEVGYDFVNANIDNVVSYMPDIGYYDDPSPDRANGEIKLPSAPGIGPVSPMFSIFGFMPIYSDAKTGQKDKKTGKDLYCLEVGVQFSIAKSDSADKEGSWDVSSVAKQYDKLAKVLDKSTADPAQSLHTSTTISLSVTFAYQLEYYQTDSGERHYTASVFLLGAKVGVKISIPFTIVVVPCFVYIDISVNNVGYLVHSPNKFTDGYWTSKMLDNSYYYETHGAFKQDFVLKFGVGVGFDGIASIGGHIDFDLNSTINGSNHGKMIFGIKGGVFAELLIFKVDYTWDIDKKVLLDTDADVSSVGANLLRESGADIMQTKLSDLELARASDVYDNTLLREKDIAEVGAEAAARGIADTYVQETADQMKPVIAQISDDRYMIATSLDDADNMICLHCYIYDAAQQKVVEDFNPVRKFAHAGELSDSEQYLFRKSDDLVANIRLVDCGEKLLLLWESATMDYTDNVSMPQFLNSFKVMGMLYDKSTGEFTDYSVIHSAENRLPDKISAVYNPSSDTVSVFFESMDISGVTGDTTMEQLNDLPLTLSTTGANISDGKLTFTEPQEIKTYGKTISDYSVTSYGDKLLLAYICADENGRILEKSLTEQKYDEAYYGTENAMYLNRYTVAPNGTLTEESSLQLANEEAVTANPEFVNVSYQGVDNTLLFYKYDGRYGYQNINNLYLLHEHYGFIGDNAEPVLITEDEDHTVGEDFKVYYGGDGELYALWTLSEGDQQQIWGRQFEIDSITDETEITMLNENHEAVLDENGSAKTESLRSPVKILNGCWGNKVNLTTGGIQKAGGTGCYKGNFDAAVVDSNHLLAAYEAFDYDYSGTSMRRINNRFVISEFDIQPYFESGVEDEEDAMEVSNLYPNPGETIAVDVKAANTGFSNAHDVTLRLMSKVNGNIETVDSVDYPVWLAGEDMEESFIYTVPQEVTDGSVELYYEISEGGSVCFTSTPEKLRHAVVLSIELAHADPENDFDEAHDTVTYHVVATVANVGNADYDRKDELTFIFNDLAAQADVMNPDVKDIDPFYINYGGVEIPEMPVGAQITLSFLSDEIPESIFDKYGTNSANLKLAITPHDGIGWKEVKGEEPYNFLDEMGIGQFEKPAPTEISEIAVEAIDVPLGKTAFLLPTVTPADVADAAVFTYSADDSGVVAVSDDGAVTALKRGTATVTVSCGDVSTTVKVTVTPPVSYLIGDVNFDGKVDIADATMIQKYAIELEAFNEDQRTVADVNGDGRISVLDTTCVQKYAAGFASGTGYAGQMMTAAV